MALIKMARTRTARSVSDYQQLRLCSGTLNGDIYPKFILFDYILEVNIPWSVNWTKIKNNVQTYKLLTCQ